MQDARAILRPRKLTLANKKAYRECHVSPGERGSLPIPFTTRYAYELGRRPRPNLLEFPVIPSSLSITDMSLRPLAVRHAFEAREAAHEVGAEVVFPVSRVDIVYIAGIY